jgi:hypothetical protein
VWAVKILYKCPGHSWRLAFKGLAFLLREKVSFLSWAFERRRWRVAGPVRVGPVRISMPASSCRVVMDEPLAKFVLCTVHGTSTPWRHKNTETFSRGPVCLVHLYLLAFLFLSFLIFIYDLFNDALHITRLILTLNTDDKRKINRNENRRIL